MDGSRAGSDLEHVARALGGAQRTTNGFDSRCPCHDDRSASLSLSVGADGRLLWHCHAGCSWEIVRDELRRRGLLQEAEGGGGRRSTGAPPAGRRIVATYDYLDEAGELVFQVVRLDPKDFRQRRRARPDDDPAKVRDGWTWSVKGLRVLPYRLPDILEAIASDRVVLIVEGEKDVDALGRLGVIATCNAGGAGKWRKQHAAALAGADVVILPDNDEPGRDHARQVAASLAGIAKRVRVLELPGLPPKGDVSDWLGAGGTADELWRLVDGAPDGRVDDGGRSDWREELLKTATGKPKALLANASLAFRSAPEWCGVLAKNLLTLSVEVAKAPPWHAGGAWERRRWTDDDDVRAAEWLQRAGIEVGLGVVSAAIVEAAGRNSYHPVRDYLNGLKWDGVERISSFANVYLGAADTVLNASISRAALIAAVARAMTPGCKADCVMVLEGPQGKLKSTAIETLFGRDWFSDELADLGSKDAAMQVSRSWCIEISELSSLSRGEVETVKAFASRRIDVFRPPYGRSVVEHLRQSVLWGTTNEDEWIKDPTGGRRFWPLACTNINVHAIRLDRDQLWAEAVEFWRRGEPWWFTDDEVIGMAREAQRERQVPDAWSDRIADYIYRKDDVSVAEVLQHGLAMEANKWGRSEQMRVAQYLRAQGWTRRYSGSKGRQKWRYFRPPAGGEEPVFHLEVGIPA